MAVERRFGKTPVTKSEMEQLAADIYSKTKHLISYNTLRRFFGTVKSTRTSSSILDFFAEYCGYQSFIEFEHSNVPDINFKTWNRLSDFETVDDDFLLELKQNVLRNDPVSLANLFYLFQKITSTKSVEEWSTFYYGIQLNSKVTDENNVLILMANMVGEYLRQREYSDLEYHYLANNQILREQLVYNFVDYKSLFEGGFYSQLIDRFLPISSEEVVFKYSLISWRYYYSGEFQKALISLEKVLEISPNELYFPIINGRIVSARLMKEIILRGKITNEQLTEVYHQIKSQPQNQVILYTMEILPLLVQFSDLNQDLHDIMDYIESTHEVYKTWNLNLDCTMYFVSRFIYHSRLKDKSGVEIYSNLISMDNTLLFYREYVEQLIKKYR